MTDSTVTTGVYTLAVQQAASFARELAVVDDDGAVVDLSDYTAGRLQVRPGKASPQAPLVDLTETAGITIDGPAGTVLVELTADQTGLLPAAGKLYYDLLLTTADGRVLRLLEGQVVVDPATTR